MFKKIKKSPLVEHALGRSFKGAHLVYFGAVAVEAHGFYGIAAGVLLVLFTFNIILGFAEEV